MKKRTPKLMAVILAIVLAAVSVSAALAAGPVQQDDQTIVDIAVADGRFTTLVAALQAAELTDTLSGEGPFTVFAPTDDAFAALPAGTVDSLLADIPTLTNILQYHVVSGKVMAADVVNQSSVDTLLGQPLTVTVGDDGTVMINEAQVIITDIEASNGVIHVIDAVLLPPAAEEEVTEDETTEMAEPQAEEAEAAEEPMAEGEAAEEGTGEAMADGEATEEAAAEEEAYEDGDAVQPMGRTPHFVHRRYYQRHPYYPRYSHYYGPRHYQRCYVHCSYSYSHYSYRSYGYGHGYHPYGHRYR